MQFCEGHLSFELVRKMPEIDRRAAIAGIAMLFVAAAGTAASPHRRMADELPQLDLESNIPGAFSGWAIDESVAPVLPAPDVQASLDKTYSRVLSRTYVNSNGARIMLVIAYGADQGDRTTLAHLPQACYSSQGFEVSPTTETSIPIGDRFVTVVHLRTRRGTRFEPITYWTTVGERAYSSELERRWARARYALRGIIPDGMLVRVSSIDFNDGRAFEQQAAFVQQLYAMVPVATRARLFGTTR